MDALSKLADLLNADSKVGFAAPVPRYPALIVPLYSENKKNGRFVAERSGLNQWNAKGRARNENEVYIAHFLNIIPFGECALYPKGIITSRL